MRKAAQLCFRCSSDQINLKKLLPFWFLLLILKIAITLFLFSLYFLELELSISGVLVLDVTDLGRKESNTDLYFENQCSLDWFLDIHISVFGFQSSLVAFKDHSFVISAIGIGK